MQIISQTKTLAKTVLPEDLVARIQSLLHILSISRLRGFDLHLNSPDRYVLEDLIIPELVACKELDKILFVGCDWYTKPYVKYFRDKEYWTIEIDENKKKFGSKRHIVDGLQNLGNYIENDYFDLIVCNGVFGWGINNKEDTEVAIKQCYSCLRPEGMLVLGWNDVSTYRPYFAIGKCENLSKFQPYVFPPLSTAKYLTENSPTQHTFNFYLKPSVQSGKE